MVSICHTGTMAIRFMLKMNSPKRCINSKPRTVACWLEDAGVRVAALNSSRPLSDIYTRAVTDDSRFVQPGDVFVAVRGEQVDGHKFLQQVQRLGAFVGIVENPEFAIDLPQVVVKNSRQALAVLAATFSGLRGPGARSPRLIGVTGTNGKTTVTWLLRSILRQAGACPALLGTIEHDLVSQTCRTPLTTPGSVELCRLLAISRDAGADWAVLEVSSHALAQQRCDGLRFAACVFTNLSGDHLDYHQTMDAYGAAKRRLFDLREEGGLAVIHIDDPFGAELARTLSGYVLTYGLESAGADVSATIEKVDRTGSCFKLRGKGFGANGVSVQLPLIGRYNVANALAAAATALAVGIDPESIAEGLQKVVRIPGRLERAEPQGFPFSVLVDYAHTDEALGHVLASLKPLTRGRLICVFGCGGDRDRSKRPRMAAAAAKWADLVYVTSDNPRSEKPHRIIDDILAGFGKKSACTVETQADRRLAIEAAIRSAREGDTVLIAGKGHEDYQLIGDRVLSFDDVQIARHCLGVTSVAEPVA